jgi:hypothetical protein
MCAVAAAAAAAAALQAASALSTPYLEYDDYTKAQAALDAAQQAMSTLMAENKALLDRLNTLERSTGRNVVPSAIATQGVSVCLGGGGGGVCVLKYGAA